MRERRRNEIKSHFHHLICIKTRTKTLLIVFAYPLCCSGGCVSFLAFFPAMCRCSWKNERKMFSIISFGFFLVRTISRCSLLPTTQNPSITWSLFSKPFLLITGIGSKWNPSQMEEQYKTRNSMMDFLCVAWVCMWMNNPVHGELCKETEAFISVSLLLSISTSMCFVI